MVEQFFKCRCSITHDHGGHDILTVIGPAGGSKELHFNNPQVKEQDALIQGSVQAIHYMCKDALKHQPIDGFDLEFSRNQLNLIKRFSQ
jgi:hypothetical protein